MGSLSPKPVQELRSTACGIVLAKDTLTIFEVAFFNLLRRDTLCAIVLCSRSSKLQVDVLVCWYVNSCLYDTVYLRFAAR